MGNNRRLTRRQLLRGAAGFTLAVPFLPSLAGRAAAGPPPTRFVGFMSLQGQFADNWYPSVLPDERIAEEVYAMPLANIPGPISRVLGSHFDPMREKLALLLGLDGMSRQFGHNSCFPLTASSATDGEVTSGAPPINGTSMDVVLADSPNFYTTPVPEPVLRLLPNTGNPPSWARTGSFSYRDSVSLPSQWDSAVVFNRLFGAPDPGEDPPAFDPSQRRSLVVDRVREDFNRVRGSARLSAADKARLENYADLLRDVQTRVDSIPAVSCDGPMLRAEATHDDAYSNHIDMLVAALACGVTRIGTIYCYHHASSGEDLGLHDVSHGDDQGSIDRSAAYNDWIGRRYLELITKLDAFVETDGSTLLDNSAVLWANDIGMCPNHYQFQYPVLMAGGLQGRLRTGVAIDYRSRPRRRWAGHEHLGRPYNQLLTSLMAAYGLSPSEWERDGQAGFGDYANIGDPYADGGYDMYAGRERDYLPHYYLG